MLFGLWLWRSTLLLLSSAVVAADTTATPAPATVAACDAAADGSCLDINDDHLDSAVKRWIDELPTEESMYLDGAWTRPSSSESDASDAIVVVDPSTGKSISRVSAASKVDVDAAVIAARRALEGWSVDTPLRERRVLVRRLLELYEENSDQMAQLMTHEMGAPIDFSTEDQVGCFSYHAEVFLRETSEDDDGEEDNRDGGGSFKTEYWPDYHEDTAIIHEAIGVAALITPWNWPMNQIALKVIPALLVGCTVILKPSEETPLSALLFARLVHDAGFPPGVFNLVNGYGLNHVGEWLASHRDVDMVSFTGSTRAGREISLAAAPTLKRLSLEMGGKGANLIFDDLITDGDGRALRDAIENGVWEAMANSGQSCDAPSRMLVPAEYWEFALQTAREAASNVSVGSAHEVGDHIGPVASRAQYDRIQSHIRSGVDEGATLLAGGPGRPRGLPRGDRDGYYVRPTVFADCAPGMTIWREEIFGPVLCMTKYASEEEAIELANDSVYGLTNYVHTYDAGRRRRLARRLRSGMIVMNGVPLAASSPFGGMKQSGHSREGGVWGLEDFCIVKAVSGLTGDDGDDDAD